MDVTSVVVGVVGVAGTLAGSWLGGRSSRGAMREQARNQAFTEHEQWLNGLRLDAYVTFLAEWDKASARIEDLWATVARLIEADREHLLEGDINEETNEVCASVLKAPSAIQPAYERVAMLGPGPVTEAATYARDRLMYAARESSRQFLERWPDEWWDALSSTLDESRAARLTFRQAVEAKLTTAPDPTTSH